MLARLYKSLEKFFGFNCELCATWYQDPLTHSAHKLPNEQQIRVHDVLQWIAMDFSNNLVTSKWDRIAKQLKTTTKLISKALRIGSRNFLF